MSPSLHQQLSSRGLSGPSLPDADMNNAASVTLSWPGGAANHPPQTSLRVRLAESAPTEECNQLLNELVDIEERCKRFLDRQTESRIAELQQRRDQLWSECRELEESKDASGPGALTGQLRIEQVRLLNLKQSRSETRPAIRSRYPTAEESNTFPDMTARPGC